MVDKTLAPEAGAAAWDYKILIISSVVAMVVGFLMVLFGYFTSPGVSFNPDLVDVVYAERSVAQILFGIGLILTGIGFAIYAILIRISGRRPL